MAEAASGTQSTTGPIGGNNGAVPAAKNAVAAIPGNANSNAASTAVNATSNPNAEVIRSQIFEVGPRYRDLTYIGEGAYGMVV